MPSALPGPRLARAVLRRAPLRLRRLVPLATRQRWLGAAAADDSRPSNRAPVLTVVIPVYNVEDYVGEALDSVLSQTLRNIEVLVVDDGSTDRSWQIIEQYAAMDPRVTAFRQENSGQGAARNLAVAHARGRFLTFMDADDTIPEDAYAFMVRTLRRTGSDFCVGSVRRVANGRTRPAPWPAAIHEIERLAITIDDFPEVMQDVIACNRMFRREFWLEKVGGFRGGIAYEDHVPMVVAFIRATRFDVLSKVTYWWRIRENQTSTGQQKHETQNLLDRIEVKAEAHEIVAAEASPTVQAAWLGRVLDTDFPPFVNHALRGDEVYRTALRDAYRRYLDISTPEALQHVRVQQKLRGWLVSRGLWDQLGQLQLAFQDTGAVPATYVADGRLYADVAIRDQLDPGLGNEMFELGALESALGGCLQRAVWVDDETLELTGWAYIKNLDLTGTTPDIRAALVESSTGERIDLPVESLVLPDATRWSGSPHANCDTSGFRLRVDATRLTAGDAPAAARWQLVFTVTARGVEREGSLHHAVDGGSASRYALRAGRLRDSGAHAVPQFDPALGFAIAIRPAGVRAEELAIGPNDRTVTGLLSWEAQALAAPVSVRALQRSGQQTVQARLDPEGAGRGRFSLTLPAVLDDEGRPSLSEWELRWVGAQGDTHLVDWPGSAAVAATRPLGRAGVAWRRTPRGYTRLVADAPLLAVRSATVTDQTLTLLLDVGALDAAEVGTVTVSSTRFDVPATRVDLSDGLVTAEFPTHVAHFGGEPLPLVPGPYWVQVVDLVGAVHYAHVAPELLAQLPLDAETPALRSRVWLSRTEQFRLSVSAPLADDERGNLAQRRLKTWHREADLEPEDSVLFQCYRGEFATDSQRALHEGLVRRGTDLTLYWGVASPATWVPDGAVPLLIGSRAWYEKLARSRYLCNNIDFDGFFRKRPHQRYLQTFHGYPFKSMGRSFWDSKGFTPERIDLELERRNAEWDSILVPSAMCEPMYREEYEYRGDVLVTGYPRCDVLVNQHDERTRAEVLRRLQVDPGKTVVLYAPTFRDALTTRTFAARRFAELDLDLLSAALGEDHVILLRGHNNNQREAERLRGRAQILDVTDYPEINDLTLAADVAVLDYSSLRFDWALTGKPMVFFVPDMAGYFAARPPLFDFEASAPGPLVTTTEAVAAELADLASVRGRYADVMSAFNATYNGLHDGKATDRVIDAFFSGHAG